jgi:hypothetical protein
MEAAMRKTLKTVHMLGLSVFLGSIAVYIALNTQHYDPGTPAFAQLRDQISLGTRYLTLPGLWATIASGVGLLWVNRRHLQRWQIAKAVVGFLLLSNTWLLVGPAIKSAAILSAVPMFSQENIGQLAEALKTETVAGAVNVALACLEIWLAVFRPALRRRHMVHPSLVART